MSFSDRLREERKRLRYTQPELATIGGTTKGSQGKYESGENPANSNYLEKIARGGVDVQYLLTGIRSGVALSPEERYVLALYRDAPQSVRKAAVAALASGALPDARRQTVTIGGDNTGIIANGNFSIQEKRKPMRGKKAGEKRDVG